MAIEFACPWWTLHFIWPVLLMDPDWGFIFLFGTILLAKTWSILLLLWTDSIYILVLEFDNGFGCCCVQGCGCWWSIYLFAIQTCDLGHWFVSWYSSCEICGMAADAALMMAYMLSMLCWYDCSYDLLELLVEFILMSIYWFQLGMISLSYSYLICSIDTILAQFCCLLFYLNLPNLNHHELRTSF